MPEGMGAVAQAWLARARELWAQRALPWWRGLQARERLVLMVAAVVLPLAMLVFGVMLPLQEHNARLHAELAAALNDAAEAERLAALIVGQGGARQRVDLLAEAERLARQAKLREAMSRIRPQPAADGGQRLLIEFRDAPWPALVRFARLLADAGIGVDVLRVQRGASSGHVHARLMLAAGG